MTRAYRLIGHAAGPRAPRPRGKRANGSSYLAQQRWLCLLSKGGSACSAKVALLAQQRWLSAWSQLPWLAAAGPGGWNRGCGKRCAVPQTTSSSASGESRSSSMTRPATRLNCSSPRAWRRGVSAVTAAQSAGEVADPLDQPNPLDVRACEGSHVERGDAGLFHGGEP